MKSSIVIISNPTARTSSFEKVKRATAYLQKRGFETKLLFSERRGHAEELAREAARTGPRLIIAAGGDGTINEVLNGMVMSDTPLAILPLGTTNVLARELSIPDSVEGAMERAIDGQVRTACLGRIEASADHAPVVRHFCLMAGVGFDAKAVYDVNSTLKKVSGEGAYIWSGISNLIHYYPTELIFSIDGKQHTGYAGIIGKASRYGGSFKITPDADILDPYFYVCIFKGKNRADLLRYAAGVIKGSHLRQKDVLYLKASSIAITGNAHIQIDGDHLGTTPAAITSVKNAITLVY
ncbi:MAG: diacylglycerol kinase family lipid kinase [Nitrospirae bacterium]|nr:diacylglycerol kinase family lipid kinase [Nitrospirota bacterium]